MRIAYFSDQAQLLTQASKHAHFERIKTLADHDHPLHFSSYTHKGVKGIMAHTEAAPPQPGKLGEGFDCADGLVYFRYGELPSQAELSRMHAVKHFDITTHRGTKLSIPLAVCSPQTLSFSGMNAPEYVDQFAHLASELSGDFLSNDEGLPLDDPRILALISLALQRTYRVTAELLDELGWITSHDVNPMLEVIYGIDPKLSGQGQPIAS